LTRFDGCAVCIIRCSPFSLQTRQTTTSLNGCQTDWTSLPCRLQEAHLDSEIEFLQWYLVLSLRWKPPSERFTNGHTPALRRTERLRDSAAINMKRPAKQTVSDRKIIAGGVYSSIGNAHRKCLAAVHRAGGTHPVRRVLAHAVDQQPMLAFVLLHLLTGRLTVFGTPTSSTVMSLIDTPCLYVAVVII